MLMWGHFKDGVLMLYYEACGMKRWRSGKEDTWGECRGEGGNIKEAR